MTKMTIIIMNGDDYLMTEDGSTVVFDTVEEARECQKQLGNGNIKECILFCDKKVNWKDIKDDLEKE